MSRSLLLVNCETASLIDLVIRFNAWVNTELCIYCLGVIIGRRRQTYFVDYIVRYLLMFSQYFMFAVVNEKSIKFLRCVRAGFSFHLTSMLLLFLSTY